MSSRRMTVRTARPAFWQQEYLSLDRIISRRFVYRKRYSESAVVIGVSITGGDSESGVLLTTVTDGRRGKLLMKSIALPRPQGTGMQCGAPEQADYK